MSRFDTFAFSWQPGTSLILFSDGITEGLNHDEEEFGLERLINVWKKAPVKDEPEETASTILTELMSFTREEPQADDQTLMILHRPA